MSVGNWRLQACVDDAYKKPRKPRKRHTQKLTDLQVEVIIGAYRRGATQKQLARTYGVAVSTIRRTITQHLRR